MSAFASRNTGSYTTKRSVAWTVLMVANPSTLRQEKRCSASALEWLRSPDRHRFRQLRKGLNARSIVNVL